MKFASIEHKVVFENIISNVFHDNQNFLSLELEDKNHEEISLDNNIKRINKYVRVLSSKQENHAYRQLYSDKKVIGRHIIFVKKVVRKLLKWYIEPIAFQQSDFNSYVTPAISTLNENCMMINEEIKKIDVKMNKIEKKLDDLNLTNDELRKELKKLNDLIKKNTK